MQNFKSAAERIFKGKYWKRNILIVTIFLLAIVYVYSQFLDTGNVSTFDYALVEKKDIKKSVEGSGKVVSVSELDIQQLSGGKVTGVYVRPGDFVRRGQIIARLDNRQASIQVAQAKASYDKILNGSTKEELDITKQGVTNAKDSYQITKQQQETAIANAKRTLLNTSIAAIPVYDSRVQVNVPIISGSYTCDQDNEYTIKFSMSDFVSVNATNDTIINGQSRITSVPQPLGNCGLFITFDMTKDYSNGEWKVTLPNKISSSYSTNFATYNNAIQARDQALLNSVTNITNAQLSLNQKAAGSRPEDIAASRASLNSAQLAYENTLIRAPFDGQIGAVSASVGQQTSTQQGVATIITKDKIAEVSLNEIDIVNVKLGQEVELTFDAIPDTVFKGNVSQINAVGLAVSNVVTFLVKISIPKADEKIKSGMSVTANIITDSKVGILSVPSATVKTEKVGDEEKTFVMKKVQITNNDVVTEQNSKVYITTGISNNVDSEIIESGNTELLVGDQIVIKTIDNNAITKTTSSFRLFGNNNRTR